MRTEAGRGSFGHFVKIGKIQERLTAMRRFGISIGPKERKAYAKSNSIVTAGVVLGLVITAMQSGVFTAENASPRSAGRRESNPHVRPRRSLPYKPRAITIIQRDE
jgi:hypothetical protein